MTRTSQPPQSLAETKAKNTFKRAEAAWQAATDAGDGTRAAALLLQKDGLYKLWQEEKAKSLAAWNEQVQLEEEEERREAEAAAAAEATKATLAERAKPPLDQVTVKRKSRKRKAVSTPVVTPPNSSSTLLMRLLQAVEGAGYTPDDQMVDLLRTSMKEIRLTQLDASRPHEEGPEADLDLHGPPESAKQGPEADRPAVQGPDAERPVQQGSGPPPVSRMACGCHHCVGGTYMVPGIDLGGCPESQAAAPGVLLDPGGCSGSDPSGRPSHKAEEALGSETLLFGSPDG
jgi:hypothetical protein